MKNLLSILLGLSLYFVATQSSVAVILDINDSNILVGELFTVDVRVTGANNVIAFGFDEAHDASWSLDSVSVAAPFSDDSAFFTDTDVAGSLFFLAPPLSGDFLLASLSFIANAAGTFQFDILSDLNDFNEGLIELVSASDLSTSIDVTINQGATQIPEPPVYLLLLGILAIFKANRWSKSLIINH